MKQEAQKIKEKETTRRKEIELEGKKIHEVLLIALSFEPSSLSTATRDGQKEVRHGLIKGRA